MGPSHKSILSCAILAIAIAIVVRLLSLGSFVTWAIEYSPYITGGVPLFCAGLLRVYLSKVDLRQRRSLWRYVGLALLLASFAPSAHFYMWGKENSRLQVTIDADQFDDPEPNFVSLAKGWFRTAMLQLPTCVLVGVALRMLFGRWMWWGVLAASIASPVFYELLYPLGKVGQGAAVVAWIGVLGGQIGAGKCSCGDSAIAVPSGGSASTPPELPR